MNPSGKNELVSENMVDNIEKYPEEMFKRFTIVATSSTDYNQIAKWDALTKRLNIPYYNLICCGLFAFSFISLGSEYTYKVIDKKTNIISKIISIKSLTFEEVMRGKEAERNK